MRRSLVRLAATVRSSQRAHRVDLPRLQRAADSVLQGLGLQEYALDVWLTTSHTLRAHNRQYRGKDKPTDVLSFPFQKLTPTATRTRADAASGHQETKPTTQSALPPAVHGVLDLGSIMISVEYVQKQLAASAPAAATTARAPATTAGPSVTILEEKTLDDRLQTLLVHGVCHLLGYDHEEPIESAQMEAEERRLLAMVKQPQPPV